MDMDNCRDSQDINEKTGKSDRRRFIAYSVGAGAVLAGVALGARHFNGSTKESNAQVLPQAAAPTGAARVVVVRNASLFGGGGQPHLEQLRKMLRVGMNGLFESGEGTAAWRSLFSPDDVVGIKVNCIAGPNLSSHPLLIEAIVSELEKVPIPRERIIVWDRTNKELTSAGYRINVDRQGLRCYGTDAVGYEEKASARRSFNGRLSKILTRRINALINVPILKNHGGAGVTIAMKNHYGSFHNPAAHHGKQCDPHIADLNSLDDIKSKTRLIVCDATRAACNGGPGHNPAFTWQYSGVVVSRDPVALDTVGTKIIEERRAEVRLLTLAEKGQYPRQLGSADERGLGVSDLSRIDLRTLMI